MRNAVAVLSLALWSCGQPAAVRGPGGEPAPQGPAPGTAPAPGEVATVPVIEPSPSSVPEPEPQVTHEPAGGGACPSGMVLVEGDYCSAVEHRCLVEWYAPQNKKRVCEQFAESAKCVGSRTHKRYCIDKFEWPNQEGVRPEVMNHFYQAQVKCAAMGKRMCSESEWSFACEGPDMKPFPYGFIRDPQKCNGDHGWDTPNMKKVARRDATELARLWKGVPSGSTGCESDFGVFDLSGNADEVVSGETGSAKFSAVNTGGPWYSGVRNQCRPKVYTHNEDFYYYYLGFRCCSNPDGKPNEPRTPRQVAKGWKWSRVESLAGFTTEQMKHALDLKEKGQCECQGKTMPGLTLKGPGYLCRTMCGTLLGPNAKDGDDSTRVLAEERKKIKR
jgi:sulfatase modifying factor 1